MVMGRKQAPMRWIWMILTSMVMEFREDSESEVGRARFRPKWAPPGPGGGHPGSDQILRKPTFGLIPGATSGLLGGGGDTPPLQRIPQG